MTKYTSYIFFILAALGLSYGAMAQCSLPEQVVAVVEHSQNWHLLDIQDLSDDDRDLWRTNHDGQCPGFVSADLDGSQWYAVALIGNEASMNEKVMLLRFHNGKREEKELVPSASVSSPFVIWKAGPGEYWNERDSKNVYLEHESIIYEKMESVSVQYFLQNGRVKSILAAE